jgi:hypothetical protein
MGLGLDIFGQFCVPLKTCVKLTVDFTWVHVIIIRNIIETYYFNN